eukprot:gene32050-41565_t
MISLSLYSAADDVNWLLSGLVCKLHCKPELSIKIDGYRFAVGASAGSRLPPKVSNPFAMETTLHNDSQLFDHPTGLAPLIDSIGRSVMEVIAQTIFNKDAVVHRDLRDSIEQIFSTERGDVPQQAWCRRWNGSDAEPGSATVTVPLDRELWKDCPPLESTYYSVLSSFLRRAIHTSSSVTKHQYPAGSDATGDRHQQRVGCAIESADKSVVAPSWSSEAAPSMR